MNSELAGSNVTAVGSTNGGNDGGLYEQINSGEGGRQLAQAASDYRRLAKQFGESNERIKHAAQRLAASWSGDASEKHQQAVRQIVDQFDRGKDAAHASAVAMDSQHEQFKQAQAAITPEPDKPDASTTASMFSPVDQSEIDQVVRQQGAATKSANAAAYRKYRNASAENASAMNLANDSYSGSLKQHGKHGSSGYDKQQSTGRSTRPPMPDGGGTPNGGDTPDGGQPTPVTPASAADSGHAGAASPMHQASTANPTANHGTGSGTPGSGSTGSASGTSPAQTNFAPSAAGYNTGGHSDGAPQATRRGYTDGIGGFSGGGSTGSGGGYGNGARSSQPGIRSGGAAGSGTGERGGNARGGQTNARPKAGPRGAGVASEEAATSRGGVGRGSGMMPPGGRGGRGGDDHEHKTASYLVTDEHANEIIGPLPPTCPPVIE